MNLSTSVPVNRQRFLLGVLLLAVANICFSGKAILVKLLYREGLDVPSVLALRMLLALPFYLGMAIYLHRRSTNVRLSTKQWLAISGLGILSYYVSSMLDFWGLQYVTASVERLVLYTYPTMVLLLSALFFKKKIVRVQLLALVLTYTGIVLAFAAEHGLGGQRNVLLGGALVFACAFTYSFYVVFTGEYVHKVGSAKFTCYTVMAATVPALLQSWMHNGLDIFQHSFQVYHLAVWLAVVATVVPTFLIVEGIRLIGANNSGIIGFVGPVATIFLGYWFLGEPVTGLQLFGTAVVLGGVFLLSWKGRG
ncbi:MAG: EamA family transporter [Lewinellaceae bacterium]|nr:EamA family transporter [Lewinellaceae bacterium]